MGEQPGTAEFRGGIYVGKRRVCWQCQSASEYDPPIPEPANA